MAQARGLRLSLRGAMSGVLAVALLFAFVHAMEIEAFGMAFAVGFLMYVSVLSGTVFGQGRNAG